MLKIKNFFVEACADLTAGKISGKSVALAAIIGGVVGGVTAAIKETIAVKERKNNAVKTEGEVK